MPRARKILRYSGYTLLAATLSGGIWVGANWTFFSRLVSFPLDRSVTAIEWYEPLEPIGGDFRAPLPAADPASQGLDPAALERAARWADAHESSAFLVLRNGAIVLERYRRGCTATTPTISHSMAKTLLGLLYGTAIERQEIASLDEPVGRHVTEWRGTAKGRITVGQLLGMESGLRYRNDRDDPFSDMVRVHLEPDLLPVVLGMELEKPPGSRFQYNNLGSQLLGLYLERATGQRYATLLAERIWKPIGARPAAVWLDREDGNAKVYGAVLATARDWARVGELVRLRGRCGTRQVVPAAFVDRMGQPSRHRDDYGLHLWLGPKVAGSPVPAYAYLDGKSKQRVFVLRSLDLVVVRTGENPEDWSDRELLELVVAAVRRG